MLQIEQLHQYYGGSHILRGVSLSVQPGQVTVLLGRNGVGKTTLLKTIMGLVPARSGRIAWENQDLMGLKTEARVRRGIGYVPQGREIFNRLTVADNLRMGMAVRPAREALPDDVLTLFPVLGEMLHRRGGDLSGGQQQQLAIARALVGRPRLLILDEPTEGIQPSIIKDIGRVIQWLAKEKNMAILLCEQYYDFAESLADHYVVMERGEVIAAGQGGDMQAQNVRALVAI
jgi:urea transport system ATP-binding protein